MRDPGNSDPSWRSVGGVVEKNAQRVRSRGLVKKWDRAGGHVVLQCPEDEEVFVRFIVVPLYAVEWQQQQLQTSRTDAAAQV